jgi:hypothetical protein
MTTPGAPTAGVAINAASPVPVGDIEDSAPQGYVRGQNHRRYEEAGPAVIGETLAARPAGMCRPHAKLPLTAASRRVSSVGLIATQLSSMQVRTTIAEPTLANSRSPADLTEPHGEGGGRL